MRKLNLLVYCLLGCFILGFNYFAIAQSTKRISILGASSGQVWYLIAAGQSQAISKYLPGVTATAEPGGGSRNIIQIANKQSEFGMTMSDNAFYALKGEREYKKAYPEIRGVIGGHSNPMKLLTRKDSSISSVADLKGKKIGMGPPGSSTALACAAIMETYGFSPNKDYTPQWLAGPEIADALADATVDAGFIYMADPYSVILDLLTKTAIRFVPLDARKILAKHPYWYKDIVPAGTYKGLEKDYETSSASVIMITHKDTDSTLVYQVTKILLEHADEIATIHPSGKEWNLKNVTRGMTVPFHPGAEKYLKERGVLK